MRSPRALLGIPNYLLHHVLSKSHRQIFHSRTFFFWKIVKFQIKNIGSRFRWGVLIEDWSLFWDDLTRSVFFFVRSILFSGDLSFFGEVEIENPKIFQKVQDLTFELTGSHFQKLPLFALRLVLRRHCNIIWNSTSPKKLGSTEKRRDLTKKKTDLVRSSQKTWPICYETGFFLWVRVPHLCVSSCELLLCWARWLTKILDEVLKTWVLRPKSP